MKHNQAPVRHCRADTAVYSVGTSGRGRFRFQLMCTLSIKSCLDLPSPLVHKIGCQLLQLLYTHILYLDSNCP